MQTREEKLEPTSEELARKALEKPISEQTKEELLGRVDNWFHGCK